MITLVHSRKRVYWDGHGCLMLIVPLELRKQGYGSRHSMDSVKRSAVKLLAETAQRSTTCRKQIVLDHLCARAFLHYGHRREAQGDTGPCSDEGGGRERQAKARCCKEEWRDAQPFRCCCRRHSGRLEMHKLWHSLLCTKDFVLQVWHGAGWLEARGRSQASTSRRHL